MVAVALGNELTESVPVISDRAREVGSGSLELREDHVCVLDEHAPCLGQVHAARVADEQADAGFAFERPRPAARRPTVCTRGFERRPR
jgi:hypothetical protein